MESIKRNKKESAIFVVSAYLYLCWGFIAITQLASCINHYDIAYFDINPFFEAPIKGLGNPYIIGILLFAWFIYWDKTEYE